MNYFLKANKNLLSYSLIMVMLISIFGINFFISLLGNIIILLFLIPLLLILLVLIGFDTFKSKVNICNNCGAISFGLRKTCANCSSDFENLKNKNQLERKPSETTIEVKAEEIK